MLSLFRTNQSYASLLLFGYALLLQLPVLIYGGVPETPAEGVSYLGQAITEWVYASDWMPRLIPPFLVALAGLFANGLSDSSRYSRTPTQIPGLLLVLVWGLGPTFRYFDVVQINNLFILFALGALGNTYKNNAPEVALFNAGFWLGLASLLRPGYLVYLPALLVAVSIFRTADLRSVFQLLVGLGIAYFLTVGYTYWRGDLNEFYVGQLMGLRIGPLQPAGLYSLISAAILSLALLIVLSSSQKMSSLLNIEGTKSLAVLYWILLITLPVAWLGAETSMADIQLLVPPLGILLGLWFVRRTPARAEFYHLILLAAAFALCTLHLLQDSSA